jgi:hypothetical protein
LIYCPGGGIIWKGDGYGDDVRFVWRLRPASLEGRCQWILAGAGFVTVTGERSFKEVL